MRILTLKRNDVWQAQRPDRDIAEPVILTEESLSARTRFSDGVTRLFDELEKRSAEQGSETTAPATLDASKIQQCIAGLLDIQLAATRMLSRLYELEQQGR